MKATTIETKKKHIICEIKKLLENTVKAFFRSNITKSNNRNFFSTPLHAHNCPPKAVYFQKNLKKKSFK